MTAEHAQLRELQKRIGYRFSDEALLVKAMTHSSLTPAGYRSYERLEFLGDAVAGLVIARELFESSEHYSEGEMTEMKSATVNRRSMAEAGRRLGLDRYIRVDRGLARRKRYPISLITDAYEGLIGAIYLDGGMEQARQFVLRTLGPELQAAEQREHPPNYKSILQELLQADGHAPPVYRTTGRTGPEHDARFQAAVQIEAMERGKGWGKTKKAAEQNAAREALEASYPRWDSDEEEIERTAQEEA